MTTYIAYIDDSGDEDYAVYTALLMPAELWRDSLTAWLKFRKNLYETYSIPADFELHATKFIRAGEGRPAPSLTYGVNTDAGTRRKILELANMVIKSIAGLKIITKVELHSSPEHCYKSLVREIERVLEAEDSWALLVIDGDNSQTYQKAAHRDLKLVDRRIIEDPWHQGSHLSQFVQMADIASYSVFQAHRLRDTRRHLWGWMSAYLHPKEWDGCCGCPIGREKGPSFR